MLPASLAAGVRVSAGPVLAGPCAAPQPEHGAGRNPLGGQVRFAREHPPVGRLKPPAAARLPVLTWVQAHPRQQIGQEVGYRKVGGQVDLMSPERAHHDDALPQVRARPLVRRRAPGAGARTVLAGVPGAARRCAARRRGGAGLPEAVRWRPPGAESHVWPGRSGGGHAGPAATTATSPWAA